jgi:hypothetical protein
MPVDEDPSTGEDLLVILSKSSRALLTRKGPFLFQILVLVDCAPLSERLKDLKLSLRLVKRPRICATLQSQTLDHSLPRAFLHRITQPV